MAGHAGLGNLRKLSYDLRSMVYESFIPLAPGSDVPYEPRRKTRKCLALLRASREIYNEIIYLLYQNQDLAFTISPNPYKARIAVSIRREHYRPVKLPLLDVPVGTIISKTVINQVYDGSKAFKKYNQLPLHRLRRVIVELNPPDINEPAELIICSSCVKWIMRILADKDEQLPPVHIVALESSDASWILESCLKASIPGPRSLTDLHILLIQFFEIEDQKISPIHLHASSQVSSKLL